MTNLALVEAFKPEQHSVEECLIELEKYGNPRLVKMKNGWYSKIEVFVTGKGIEFEVSSEFSCRNPQDAINQCHARLVDAFKRIKET
jgi:hypothetical protein